MKHQAPMRAASQLLAAGFLFAAFSSSVQAAAPEQFGTDHDDPRTAYPPVARPPTPSCSVEIVDHGFNSFEPTRSRIDAGAACPGPWHRVVLEMDGEVHGRQYDRIGHLAIGGVTVFRTSSPEPSRDGITWHVEKDITEYASLLKQPQPVEMHLGSVINETYTGVFQIRMRIVFYRSDDKHPAAQTADSVATLDGQHEDGTDIVGTVTLPANAERLVTEVYATGSGGGCEEFWYYSAPADESTTGDYWCKGEQGPYREVQVLVDGRVAGIAAPYPHIYTGGWSNPYLWYVIPAPRTFDIHPIRFELTPFIGAINDGKAHEIRLHVLGLPKESKGWALHPNVQVWRDAGSKATHGELLEAQLSELELANPLVVEGKSRTTTSRGRHAFKARGVLKTSHGRVETTIERDLASDLRHRWEPNDEYDGIHADWVDHQVITRKQRGKPQMETQLQRFGLDGAIATQPSGGKSRLTTTLKIHDDADLSSSANDKRSWSEMHDRFSGSASYTADVPREQRRAVATTEQTFVSRDDSGACYARTVRSRNGAAADERAACAIVGQGGQASKP